MIQKKEIQQWKRDEVDYLVDLFKKYKNIAIIDIAGINDRQIQDVRKKLRGNAVVRMSKKSLQTFAIEKFKKESKKPNLDELMKNIPAQSSFVFSNMDAFELNKIFQENKWMVPAKPGEVTPVDIWVPAGDTGLPTGQVISELNMTLRLPTRIQNDTIWVREDTRTHKAGDVVTVKQAGVLKKLGITPLESLIKIDFAWSDGEIIPKDVIYMDIDALIQDIISAQSSVIKVALEVGVIDEATVDILIQKAYREAIALLFEMPFIDERMLEDYLRKAEQNANALKASIFGIESSSKAEKIESKDKKPKKGKDDDEDDEDSVGIGSLF
ncbi:MAG: 50S ribosomal protein L10 [Promethearchaeota archaeon]